MTDAITFHHLNSGEWHEVMLADETDALGIREQTVLQKTINGSIHIGHRFMRPETGRWEWERGNGITLDREGVARLKEGLL